MRVCACARVRVCARLSSAEIERDVGASERRQPLTQSEECGRERPCAPLGRGPGVPGPGSFAAAIFRHLHALRCAGSHPAVPEPPEPLPDSRGPCCGRVRPGGAVLGDHGAADPLRPRTDSRDYAERRQRRASAAARDGGGELLVRYVMTNGLVDAMLLSDPNARPSSKALVSTLANLGKDALDRATT